GFSSPSTFTIDTTAPTPSLTAPPNGSFTKDTTPSFSGAAGTATGDSATVTVNVYAGTSASGSPVQTLPAIQSGASWTVTASPALGEGTYTARAQQSDLAGNVGFSSPSTFSV